MPGFNGTGPRGSGPLTGGGRGYCAVTLPEPGADRPAMGYAGLASRPIGGLTPTLGRPRLGMRLGGGRGLGLGRGRRGGRGRGRR